MESGFLIDRDGVLTTAKGGAPIPGAVDWMTRLRASGRSGLVATNHTTSSPAAAAAELRTLGFPVTDDQVLTPLSILHRCFRERPPGRTFGRGTPAFLAFLAELGADLVDDDRVDTVVLGFDRFMDAAAVSRAVTAIIRYGARFIALHENRLFRGVDGRMEPGLGAWVRAVEYATGSRALIVGKPSREYYRRALDILGVPPERAVMVSDDPLGDLAGAKSMGIRTVFVTSGKYTADILEQLPPDRQPDRTAGSLAEIVLD